MKRRILRKRIPQSLLRRFLRKRLTAGKRPALHHLLNTNPEDKKRVLVPLINRIAAGHNYTRPRALQGLVIHTSV